MLFVTLFEIVGYLINLVVMLVIVQFVMSLLIGFNVVNTRNEFVQAVWKAVNAILNPVLRPVRRLMPDTGSIDLSPMVLIIGLTILQIVLKNLAFASAGL